MKGDPVLHWNPRRLVLAPALAIVFLSSAVPAWSATFTLQVRRLMTCNDGATGGALSVNGKEIGRTLELPWTNDAQGLSRVQSGRYAAAIRSDGTKGWRIELKNVPNHERIQLHIGNYTSQTEGCILVGSDVKAATDPGTGKKTCMVTNSAAALQKIRDEMQAASGNGVSSQDLAITVVIAD
ncbi:MAG: hypothetical protein IPP07_07890 [Holophagales bacterium]|jgi:hypothetical protein|nr:hypothetical protein [Holophagales bacterium]MBK9964820.1 hypothetical protein [Holophagales bacterium]